MSELLPEHKWIETDDGSLTLFSERFQETCHSSFGAKSETLMHYVQGCKVTERIGHYDPFVILEVGFGLGVGFLTTLEQLKDNSHRWHFISLEIDRNLIEWFREKHPGLAWRSDDVCEWVTPGFTLTVLVGDGRETLPEYLLQHHLQFHAIYQDAFSHRKNPTLWTREWFAQLKHFAHEDVILSTYSSSTVIRKSLLEAGWFVGRGESFGSKRSSTRARLKGESDPVILSHIKNTEAILLTDENLL